MRYLCPPVFVEVCRQTEELRELSLSTEISQAHQKLWPLECMVSYKDWIWAFFLLLIHPLLSLSVRAAFHLLQLLPDLSTFFNSNGSVFHLPCFAEPSPVPVPLTPFPHLLSSSTLAAFIVCLSSPELYFLLFTACYFLCSP